MCLLFGFMISTWLSVIRLTDSCSLDNSTLVQCPIPDYWQTNYSCNDWNFISRDAITVGDTDFVGDHKWVTIMWFYDEWDQDLEIYQKMLEQSFTYAVLDLHDKWGRSKNMSKYDISSVSVNDIFVNVTWVLAYCMLDHNNDCKHVKYFSLPNERCAIKISKFCNSDTTNMRHMFDR